MEIKRHLAFTEDVKDIELKLYSPPTLEYLGVFIKDSNNPTKYWLRKICVKLEQKHVCMEELDLEEFADTPYHQESLQAEVQKLARIEREIVRIKNPRVEAVIGVAEYKGNKKLTLEEILGLIAVKYQLMRENYTLKNNFF